MRQGSHYLWFSRKKIFDCLSSESDGPVRFLLVERFQVTGRRGEEGLTNKPGTKRLFNTRSFDKGFVKSYNVLWKGIRAFLQRTVSKIFCNFCVTL